MAALILTTGEENIGQRMAIPVPGRSSPLIVEPVVATPPAAAFFQAMQFGCRQVPLGNDPDLKLFPWEKSQDAAPTSTLTKWIAVIATTGTLRGFAATIQTASASQTFFFTVCINGTPFIILNVLPGNLRATNVNTLPVVAGDLITVVPSLNDPLGDQPDSCQVDCYVE